MKKDNLFHHEKEEGSTSSGVGFLVNKNIDRENINTNVTFLILELNK